MKRILLGLLSGISILTACHQVPAGDRPLRTATPVVAIQSATETPSPRPTSTSLPTETPTPSITPLPTIPTFTPTFDVSTIVTVTPAPKAECPEIDPTVKIENYLPSKLEYPSPNTTEKILSFLNEGGNGQTLIARLERIYPDGGDYRGGYAFRDSKMNSRQIIKDASTSA
jgi:hypothetical protein